MGKLGKTGGWKLSIPGGSKGRKEIILFALSSERTSRFSWAGAAQACIVVGRSLCWSSEYIFFYVLGIGH